MSKSRALFDPGKILEAAENGLTYLFVKFEGFVERRFGGNPKYAASSRRIDLAEKRMRQENRELTKSQDTFLEVDSKGQLTNLAEKQEQITERMQHLNKSFYKELSYVKEKEVE
ncbi:MAG: hypothetical protein DWP94_04425 [Flavobacterium sp.]|nr:MAG: hypothetical protein DWP94_04425 [Flavobacterium sp.]